MEGSGSFTVQARQEVQVFTISGYFAGETGSSLQKKVEELFKSGSKAFVLDFQGCKVINSQGIGAVMDLSLKILDDYRGKIAIVNVDSTKIAVFQLVGVFPLVPLSANMEEAIKAVKI